MGILINYKTKEKILWSWDENPKDFHGQKVYYIGVTGGLGGYRKMLQNGFVDRDDIKPPPPPMPAYLRLQLSRRIRQLKLGGVMKDRSEDMSEHSCVSFIKKTNSPFIKK